MQEGSHERNIEEKLKQKTRSPKKLSLQERLMELSTSVRLSEGGEQAGKLLTKLTDLIEANSITKPRFLKKSSFNLFIEHELRAGSGNLNIWDKWIFCLRAA